MRRREAADDSCKAASGRTEDTNGGGREVPSRGLPELADFFRRSWDDHDAEERAHHAYQARVDHCGVLALAALYGCAAWASAPEAPLPEVPAGILAAQLVLTALALHNLYMELFVIVKVVKADESTFFVGKGPLGRWIWMTHQIIGIQAVHFAFSLLAPLLNRRLALGTYRLSVLLGGLGTFVTIQFFFLVYPTSAFTEECRVWAPRVPQYRLIQSYLHLPQLLLAVSDVCLLKQRSTLLLASPPALTIVLVYAVYCVTYIAVVHANHSLTGYWPYGLMDGLGKSAARWLQFMAAQGAILSSLALGLWAAARLAWAAW
mmetsp:Transcript_20742/g.58341  ORF Transcript_20742/g.58341 Transcript_20742/m.58341 type:complete len:318 (-) Transcript_20742:38-991(-)